MTASVAAAAYGAKARRALGAAKLLFAEGNTEGTCNRAYYAMYYAAHVALNGVVGSGAEYKTHRGLVAAFGKKVIVGGFLDVEFGRSLNEMQRIRELADYLGDPPALEDAAFAIAAAERFVSAVEHIWPNPQGRGP